MYHIALDLTPERIKKLKRKALASNTTVKGLVTQLVLAVIEGRLTPVPVPDKKQAEQER